MGISQSNRSSYKIEIYRGRINQCSDEPYVQLLSKMPWKFVKIIKITAFTVTTFFKLFIVM